MNAIGRWGALVALLVLAAPASASSLPDPEAVSKTGSTAFCLYELPGDGNGGRRRWVNLGIVQYVEIGHSEVIIYFGGGNFGSGHEAKIPVANPQEALGLLHKMGERARACI
ncbi:MAG: hypothetical protein ACM3SV_00240 [Betaproteobacteria bacterium]